jgi:hypothetical protein
MRIIVAEELRKQGVEPTSILWNLNQGGEDIDIVFGLRDDVFFLELKDRAFGVGDAYPFNYRLQNWGGTFGIVFSTDRVAEEAKAVFARDPETAAPWARVQPPLVEFVEGCETLGRRLTEIIDARDLLWLRRRFLGEFPELNINSIIRGHIKRLSGSRPGDATVVSTPAAEIRG